MIYRRGGDKHQELAEKLGNDGMQVAASSFLEGGFLAWESLRACCIERPD